MKKNRSKTERRGGRRNTEKTKNEEKLIKKTKGMKCHERRGGRNKRTKKREKPRKEEGRRRNTEQMKNEEKLVKKTKGMKCHARRGRRRKRTKKRERPREQEMSAGGVDGARAAEVSH